MLIVDVLLADSDWLWLVADDGRAEFDTSIVASMEVNGIVYQGVLFAQPPNIVGARMWDCAMHLVCYRP